MKKACIVHGWGGFTHEGWYPWLHVELEKLGYMVESPSMPDTDYPRIEAWVGHLAKIIGEVDTEYVLIGHSIGCQTILRYLEKIKTHCNNFVCIFSDNDPFVPLTDAGIFKEKLGAKIITENAQGHFTESDGITELPIVLEHVKK